MPGRKLLLHRAGPTTMPGDGRSTTKPGRFSFSEPRPYKIHEPIEGRMGVTVTFMAILELVREGLIEIVQAEPFAPLHVRASGPGRTLRVVADNDVVQAILMLVRQINDGRHDVENQYFRLVTTAGNLIAQGQLMY